MAGAPPGSARRPKNSVPCASHRNPCGCCRGVLLGNARDRERLAGEPGQQQVVLRNVRLADLGDVTGDRMAAAVVGLVRELGVAVPFARVDALPALWLEPAAHAPDAREQVDERERGNFWRRRVQTLDPMLEKADGRLARGLLSALPTGTVSAAKSRSALTAPAPKALPVPEDGQTQQTLQMLSSAESPRAFPCQDGKFRLTRQPLAARLLLQDIVQHD